MKNIINIAILVLLPLLAACNTMEGFGRDVKTTGQAIEEKAD